MGKLLVVVIRGLLLVLSGVESSPFRSAAART
jgi:hypothetical protein